MKIDLSRHVPPGLEPRPQLRVLSWGLALSLGYSAFFFGRFADAKDMLYTGNGLSGKRRLLPGAIMEDFAFLLDGALDGFLVSALCMLAFGVYYYLYHHQGSKSVYLMRRLPQPWERHRRCLALPLSCACLALLAAFFVLLAYYWYYMVNTPAQCLQPGQWQKIWRI